MNEKKLNILMVLHMPWERTLGAPKAQIEIADEFIKLGHNVDKYDIYDALPFLKKWKNPVLYAFKNLLFAIKTALFIRKVGNRYDVIDAHQGNIPFSKRFLKFDGLLVVRSAGLYEFYYAYNKFEKKYLKGNRRFIKDLVWLISAKINYCLSKKSIFRADVIHVPNHDELTYLRNILFLHNKSYKIFYGISLKQHNILKHRVKVFNFFKNHKTIVYIGSWIKRKGSEDWNAIINYITKNYKDINFLFVGTKVTFETIKTSLPEKNWKNIKVIPNYKPEDLVTILQEAGAGAFPSYIEGFGLGVLEMLSAGIPVVSYDIPGPREMLRYLKEDDIFLVKPGDVESFSESLLYLLNLPQNEYFKLSRQCIRIASNFTWDKISFRLLDIYKKNIKRINNK